MGVLIDGRWHNQWYDTASNDGRFVRSKSAFHGRVSRDGSSGYPAEAGRYHLYLSLACPWAHRTLIFRKLKKLEDAISVSVVHWHMGADGWEFRDGPGCTPDSVNGAHFLRDVYLLAQPRYSGRVTVPALWDKKTGTIVNNESAEIIRQLNRDFDAFGDPAADFYPAELASEIDRLNSRIYATVNNGVYRCGFATTQAAYDEAFDALFGMLDELEARLGGQRYLVGAQITEADWRLFTTLVRFDAVYYGHFKCNRHRIADYPNLSNYLRDLYQVPGVAETVDLHHIKHHYYGSHLKLNPSGIVPKGPELDFSAPHDRGRFAARGAGRKAAS